MPLFKVRKTPMGYMGTRYVEVGHLNSIDVDLFAVVRYLDRGDGSACRAQYLETVVPRPIWSNHPIARSRAQIANQFAALVSVNQGFADNLVKDPTG